MARPSARVIVLTILGVAIAAFAIGIGLRGASSPGGADGTAQTPVDSSAESPAGPTGTSQQPTGETATPSEPAAAGAPLERITTPPERSLWALPLEFYDEGVELSVEIEPYGIGPSTYGPSIVALVISAKLADPAVDFPDIVDQNVVFVLGDAQVSTGGRYAGTAVTRQQDDRLVLVLEGVSRVP